VLFVASQVRDAVNEIRALASVRHAHVVGFLEVCGVLACCVP
jgi:hypothetical protein